MAYSAFEMRYTSRIGERELCRAIPAYEETGGVAHANHLEHQHYYINTTMKLHLPKTLLVAVLAACSTAYAFGPQDVEYTEITAVTNGAQSPTVSTYYSNVENNAGTISITTPEGKDKVHIKLGIEDVTGTEDVNDLDKEATLGTISAASTWIAEGRFNLGSANAVANAGDLYVNGGALHIGVDADTTIGNNITLGTSTYASTSWSGHSALNSAALIIGHYNKTNKDVTFSGNLTIADNAKICMQSGYDLNLTGELIGSANLDFSRYSNGGGTNSTITLSGSAEEYTGNITVSGGEYNGTTYTNTLKLSGDGANLLTYAASITVGAKSKLDLSAIENLTFTDTLAGKITNSGSIIIDEAVTVNTSSSIGTLEIVSLEGFETTITDEYSGGTNTGNGYRLVNIQAIADASTTKEGINIKVADETFLTNADGAIYGAKDLTTFYVNSGSEELSQAIVNAASVYRVAENGTLDIIGLKLEYDKVYLGSNATLKNSANIANVETQRQLAQLELEADANVSAESGKMHGLVENGYGTSYLTLNGHTLTKIDDGIFFMVNTTVSGGGTIKISDGQLMIGSSGGTGKTTTATGVVFDTDTEGVLKISNTNTLKAAGVQGTGGKITGTAGTGIELDSANNYSFGGAVEGSVDLTKKGTGTQTFTGATSLDAVEVQAGKLAFASDNASVNSANVTGGTLEIASGKTLTATGTMTIGAGTLALSSESAFAVTGAMTFNAGAQLSYTLTATPADTDTKLSYTLGTAGSFVGLDNLTYTGNTPDGYTGLLSADGSNLMLNFVLTEMELTSITVTKVVGFADGVLTLKTDAANALAYVFGEQLDVAIDDDLWKSAIAYVTDDYAQAFSISLQNAEGSEISFGENQLAVVLNSQSGTVLSATTAGTYSVPEPTTATLSLLALAALAARRRRR